ncbi:ABC transporter permease [Mesorhizobium sp. SP-1A]|uniref:ABC transporter permease n=1 Tax=Mesorhizobium sp. SP-1A TaxID=3077840 RepID=UPI0028F6E81F|nr:ABC transporter permease [Mesorhizobium sp. SP-1A]
MWFVLALVVVAASIASPEFRNADNAANILKQSAVLGILAVGQTFVVVAGMLDLSVGMAAGLVVVIICALTGANSAFVAPAVGLILIGGSVLGLINGYLIEKLRVHSVIYTFGMLSILQGLIFTYTDSTVGTAPEFLKELSGGDLFGFPLAAIILLVLAASAHWLLERTRFGYHLKAAGGNPQSATRSGLNVTRLRMLAFGICGLSASAAGLMLAGRLGAGYPLAGVGLELDTVVAVVLGGTTLAGGRGNVINSVGGVLALTVMSNALNLLEISSFVQMFLKGAIVVLAILANRSEQRQS